ncbi:LysR family transcriptional regulator [Methylobacterium dankookense]|uniref:HTH-type transcriptional regulator GltR n=1 Tax=Methylobacterium dankookense TaxID=560405 RepID=A0A564G5L9_9HYPH|nr:LysR family transcriptional regulator [Methylobacterium dankookense]GJD55768.1 HTH-type transcriptional regulator GltR [Methylobacterium dankookense]VUF15845.1 HTH-type transcriptional regulator GltR [Methylobacterium dankookense]
MADFRSLEIFYWVATFSSFRRASEQVNTTQPAVSQRIAALEHEYGTLFERRTRDVVLTERGRALLGFAERFLALRAEMETALSEPGRMTGTLRLGVSETIVQMWLMRFVERMRAAYPGVSVDITVDISPNMQAALLANDIDLAFLVGPITLPNLVNRPLFSTAVAWIAAPRLVAAETPLSLGELLRHPLITYPKNTSPYVELRDLVLRANLLPSQIHTSASLATIVKMGVEGLGICLIPPGVVRRELAAGELRVLPAEQGLSDIGFTATYANRPDHHLVAEAARLAQEVAEAWAAQDWHEER